MNKLRNFSFWMLLLVMFQSMHIFSEIFEFNDPELYTCVEKEEIYTSGKPLAGEAIVTYDYFTTAKTQTMKSDRMEDGKIIRTTRICRTKNPSWNWKNIGLTAGGAAAVAGLGLAYASGINFADIAKLVQSEAVTQKQAKDLEESVANIEEGQAEINKNLAAQNVILSEVSPELLDKSIVNNNDINNEESPDQKIVVEKSWFDQPMTIVENDDLEASPYGPTTMQGLANEADMSAKLAATGLGAASAYAQPIMHGIATSGRGVAMADAISAARETGRAGGSFADMGRSAGSSYGGAVNGYPGAIDYSTRFANVGSKLDKIAPHVTPALTSAKEGAVKSIKYGAAIGGGAGAGLGGVTGAALGAVAIQPDDDLAMGAIKIASGGAGGAAAGATAGALAGGLTGASLAIPYQAGAGAAQVLGATGRGQALAGMGTLVGTTDWKGINEELKKSYRDDVTP